MKIDVYYMSGQIDEFDTASLTTGDPFRAESEGGSNLITEFIPRFDRILYKSIDELTQTNQVGLVVEVWWYNTVRDHQTKYHEFEDGKRVAYCGREIGRNIQLVAPGEIKDISHIAMDGMLVTWQQDGYFIDAIAFERQCALWGIGSNLFGARTLFDVLEAACGNKAFTRDVDIVHRMGWPYAAYLAIKSQTTAVKEYMEKQKLIEKAGEKTECQEESDIEDLDLTLNYKQAEKLLNELIR